MPPNLLQQISALSHSGLSDEEVRAQLYRPDRERVPLIVHGERTLLTRLQVLHDQMDAVLLDQPTRLSRVQKSASAIVVLSGEIVADLLGGGQGVTTGGDRGESA